MGGKVRHLKLASVERELEFGQVGSVGEEIGQDVGSLCACVEGESVAWANRGCGGNLCGGVGGGGNSWQHVRKTNAVSS